MRHFKCILLLGILVTISNCAAITGTAHRAPLDISEAQKIIDGIKEQDERVHTFYSRGSILAKKWAFESEAGIFIVGKKNPFSVKIEITHPWGHPMLHLLVREKRLAVLSFSEKILYMGPFTSGALTRFFPADLDAGMIWGVLRGYPNLLSYRQIQSPKANQIVLLNKNAGEVEKIELHPKELSPWRVSFPKNRIRLAYSDYEEKNGIRYAREVVVNHSDLKKNLILRSQKMVFNKTLPNHIFKMDRPASFRTVYLSEDASFEND